MVLVWPWIFRRSSFYIFKESTKNDFSSQLQDKVGVNSCRNSIDMPTDDRYAVMHVCPCFITHVSLVSALNTTTGCTSDVCKYSYSRIVKNMDFTADPCSDFHRYTCGGSAEPVPWYINMTQSDTPVSWSLIFMTWIHNCFLNDRSY